MKNSRTCYIKRVVPEYSEWLRIKFRQSYCKGKQFASKYIKISPRGHHNSTMCATEQATGLRFLPYVTARTQFISLYLYLNRSFWIISFILSTCSRLAGNFSVKSTFRLSSAYGRKMMWKPTWKRGSKRTVMQNHGLRTMIYGKDQDAYYLGPMSPN